MNLDPYGGPGATAQLVYSSIRPAGESGQSSGVSSTQKLGDILGPT